MSHTDAQSTAAQPPTVPTSPTRRITEAEIIEEILKASIRATMEPLEAFASWLLAGVGASAALLAVNLDKVLAVVPRRDLRLSFLCLAGSLVVGAFAKFQAALLARSLTMSIPDHLLDRIDASKSNLTREKIYSELKAALGKAPASIKPRGNKALWQAHVRFVALVIFEMSLAITSLIVFAQGMAGKISP